MILKDLGEFNFIDRISRGIKLSTAVVKGIGDDTAVLKYTREKYLLFTCDMLLEGRHFYKNTPARLVGRKSLSCSISDIAAMGGVPKFALVSIGLVPSLDLRYADDLYKGLKKVARRFDISLVGGDTISSDKIIIDIALLGEVEKQNLVLRDSAKNGDVIFITGTIGGSLKGKHLIFTPRLEEARFLVRNFKINSMIDVSDGLIADLCHILKLSNVGAVIRERQIPISKNADSFDSAIRDGEDFELLFTVKASQAYNLVKKWPFKTKLSLIGEISGQKKGLHILKKNNILKKVTAEGFAHF